MCIRDSGKGGLVLKEAGKLARAQLPEGVFLELFVKVDKDCLLYTSDAADDLLCVDLGGRRIIKKKKQHTITLLHDNTHVYY